MSDPRGIPPLPVGPLARARDFIVQATAQLGRPIKNTYRLLAKSDGLHVVKWDGTDVGPLGSDPLTTKGDLHVYGSSSTRLAVGSDTQVLTADSTQATGLKWAAPGSGGVTVQYPGLKPGTPTYDFAGASLDGAFSAHSDLGTFATTNCKTQGIDWMGSALEMQFSEQFGALYVTHSNGDIDFSVGGLRAIGFGGPAAGQVAWGIAALNSSGTGVGLIADTNGNFYSTTITTWNAATLKANWTSHGSYINSDYKGDYWMRITRVSGTWTYYGSLSGRAWDKTFATSADSITVDRIAVGLFFNNATAMSGRLILDYFQVDV